MSDPDSSRRAREDALWQDIVAHYAETASEPAFPDRSSDLSGDPAHGPSNGPANGPANDPASDQPWKPDASPEPVPSPAPASEPLGPPAAEEPQEWFSLAEHEEFVPPRPSAFPLPATPRLLAWLGVLGVPVIVLVLAVTNAVPPVLVDVLLLGWFLAGFGYLVATMRRDGDGDGDGAVV